MQTGEAGEEMDSPGDTEESEPAYDSVEETDTEDQAQEEAEEEEMVLCKAILSSIRERLTHQSISPSKTKAAATDNTAGKKP